MYASIFKILYKNYWKYIFTSTLLILDFNNGVSLIKYVWILSIRVELWREIKSNSYIECKSSVEEGNKMRERLEIEGEQMVIVLSALGAKQ